MAISVRELVEFVWRHGDLSAGRGGPSALEGARGHRWLQKQREGFECEVPLSQQVTVEDMTLLVAGRADAVRLEGDLPLVEEIKTTLASPLLIRDDNPVHWGQAKIYGHMLACDHGLDRVEIQLTYLNVETRDTRSFQRILFADELATFFEETVQSYVRWISRVAEWQQVRNEGIRQGDFPFEVPRSGQLEMAKQVERCGKGGTPLFIDAPCGSGKTMGVLFGALLALAAGHVGQLLCLTAKTVGAGAVKDAVDALNRQGMMLKALTLVAKSRQCSHPESTGCDPRYCPLAKGHFDRLRRAMDALFSKADMSTAALEAAADESGVCAYWLSRAMVTYADVVILDYNYVFDPRAGLISLTMASDPPKLLLIDEAHNLPERARTMFSATLRQADLRTLTKETGHLGKQLSPLVSRLKRAMKKVNHESSLEDLAKMSPDFTLALTALIDGLEMWLQAMGGDAPDGVLNAYFELLAFSRALKRNVASDRFVIHRDAKSFNVTLFAVDPAVHLQQVLAGSKAVSCFYSATLTPIDFFKQVLCGDTKADALSLPPIFPDAHRLPIVVRGISTKFADRDRTIGHVADVIHRVVQAKKGNYLAFFPSFAYLDAVAEALQLSNMDIDCVRQTPDFSEPDKQHFLSEFKEGRSKTLLGLAALGGLFSEGVDLPGERLIGTVVVSPGLPMISDTRQMIRRHFDETARDGFGFAYIYPGMNRVIQAAGRVIRSEIDKGVLVFVGERFGQRPYLELLKERWPDMVSVDRGDVLSELLGGFWG